MFSVWKGSALGFAYSLSCLVHWLLVLKSKVMVSPCQEDICIAAKLEADKIKSVGKSKQLSTSWDTGKGTHGF